MAKMPPKAYNNVKFLNSAGARTIRMLAEYVEPKSRLDRKKIRDTIVFFGSARFSDAKEAARRAAQARTPAQKREAKRLQAAARYYEEARELARRLTLWSEQRSPNGRRFVICSGGGPGIMEAANRGAHEAGGISLGLNISLPLEQEPNPYITPGLSFQFHYFFMRKLWFAYLAKVLVVFPGRYGTMDEMMETLTLTQTEKLNKKGSSGFLVGGQRVAGSSILPTRRRPQSHRSPKGGQEIPKYPTRQSGRGQLVKGIRH